jgi:uncharacterized RDD family membrane protein YckC
MSSTSDSAEPSRSPESGVVYRREDCAGFFRRCLVTAIDGFVLLSAAALGIPLGALWFVFDPQLKGFWLLYFLLWSIFAYLYLVIPGPTKIGTLGFILAGVKIVDLRGRQPSFLRMTLRFFLLGFALWSPIYILLDLLWLGADGCKQTILDKATGTYLVRKDALPPLAGVQITVPYQFFGLSLMFPEVKVGREIQASSY